MKRVSIYIIISLLTFMIGVIVVLSSQLFKRTGIERASVQLQPISDGLRPEMIKVIYAPNEPLKIGDIRLADEHSATSDILIEVENTSSKKIAYFQYQLVLFKDCPDSFDGGTSVAPPNGIDNHPIDMALEPKGRTNLRIGIHRNIYKMILDERKMRNCSSSINAELYLSLVVFSDISKWDR